MTRVMDGLMEGVTGTGEEKRVAHQLASLPKRLGRIAERGPSCPRIVSSLWRQTCSAPIVLAEVAFALDGTAEDAWAAWPRRLRTRAIVPEKTLARICSEAGATVRANVKF